MVKKLGKYEIKSELGRGAMGVVYLAEDARLGRPVALKTMSSTVAGEPELLKRFYREAQSAGQLRHPNIVTIYDIDEAEGVPFIAMEFLEGEAVEKLIASRRDITVVKKLDIIVQTCRGLHYAHQHGIVHRDVKPANIVLLTDGQVKLVDFGIARIGGTSMTRTGIVMGTPMYMSPEQIQGQTVDARSDIFSVGVILYELLTYQNPFAASDVPTILFKILNEPPQSITTIVPNCPQQLEQVILRAVAKNREQRYQSAEDVAFDLQHVADSMKRQMLDLYIQEGQRGYEEGNLTLAKESLQKVLEIDSGHDMAKSLLDKVQKQIYQRQRGQKIDQGMRQVKEALRAEQYDEAIAVLDEILRLDPDQAEAQQYKKRAVEKREQLQKMARAMARAEKFVADADYKSAKAELEAALAIDRDHVAAQTMLENVLRELSEQDRLRQVRKHTEAARSYLAEKNFAKVIELLDKAKGLDPLNIEVETLMRLARSGQEQAGRRQLLMQRQAEIQEALNREDYETALAAAETALHEFPDDSQLVKLQAQAARLSESQKKRRRIDEQLQAARDCVQKNQYAQAIEILERALESAPDDHRLTAFLRTVQEAQAAATVETLVKQAIREANDLIRRKDFSSAISVLERAIASAGHSQELESLMQYAREQQGEQQRQERVRQVLTRAQSYLKDDNFEEAERHLERAQADLKAEEIDALLKTARDRKQRLEQRRKDVLAKARQMLQSGEATKALAALDAAPKAFFMDPEIQSVYALCREAVSRTDYIRTTIDQVEKHISDERLDDAEPLLNRALQTYPDDKKLAAALKTLREEQARLREAQWGKRLDDAKVAVGRMRYAEAIQLLQGISWDSANLPELAAEAKALLKEAQAGETETQKRETVMYRVPPQTPATPRVPPPAADSPALVDSQKRLREAMQGQFEKPEPIAPGRAGRPKGTPPPTQVEATLGLSEQRGYPGRAPAMPPPAPAPTLARQVPAPVLTPVAEVRRRPAGLWVGIGALAVVIAGVVVWRIIVGGATGTVQLSATPWAEVVSVQNTSGKRFEVSGQTPLQVPLPPGKYVFELKNDKGVGKLDVVVESGKVSPVNYAQDVNVNDMVNEIVSKY